MSKKEKLLKELREGGLLSQNGGALSIAGTESITGYGNWNNIVRDTNTLPSDAFTNFNVLIKNLAFAVNKGNQIGELIVAFGGSDFVTNMTNNTIGSDYFLPPTHTIFTGPSPTGRGLPKYIATQIAAGLANVPATQGPQGIQGPAGAPGSNGSAITDAEFLTKLINAMNNDTFKNTLLNIIKAYDGNNKFVTIGDFTNKDVNNNYNDGPFKDAIEAGPLVQFKHLPDPSVLGPFTAAARGGSKHKRTRRSKTSKY